MATESELCPDFPLAEFLGLRLAAPEPGRAFAHLNADDRHANPNGVVHGAVLFAMIDTAMGFALQETLEPGERCATTDIHVRYLRPARRGELEAAVTVTHRGRRTATLDAQVVTSDGALVATATGAYMILDGLP